MIELLEARIAAELAELARARWAGEVVRGLPPTLGADATRAALERAGATTLWRVVIGAIAAAEDPGPLVPPAQRSPAAFVAVTRARAKTARRLGFPDAWTMARAIAGEPAAVPDAGAYRPDAGPGARHPSDGGAAPPLDQGEAAFEAALGEPARLVRVLGLDPSIVRVEVIEGDAPEPGRTFVVEPGRDVRVRVWRRPETTARGTLRVLLHELGHARVAAASGALAPPSRAHDEGVAAWAASLLEREAFLAEVLAAPVEVAGVERAARARRRARLAGIARAEHDWYRGSGPSPWREPLAWTDVGGAASYAAAEAIRDELDARVGAGWPVAELPA